MFRQLAEHTHEVFWIFDTVASQLLYVSPAYETVWGRTRESLYAQPRSWLDAVHPEDHDKAARLLEVESSRDDLESEYRIVRPDASVRTIWSRAFAVRDETGQTYRTVGAAEDVTERKRLERQLHAVQRMEAIGLLAGGIAHDFNNLMSVILGRGELLLELAGQRSDVRRSVEEILKAGKRAAALTRQLLAFSRHQVEEPAVLDLNAIVSETGNLLQRLIGNHIEIVLKLYPELGRIKGDQSQIEQALMNLAVNARDAMPQGGRLTLETANVELGPHDSRHRLILAAGSYVTLSVSDTGVGMDAETQAHIFEPFFTTKAPGAGTGLGLATVYGIVKQSNGQIWVYSEPGQGAMFKIYLPRLGPSAEAPEPAGVAYAASGSRETVLLLEDEDGLRDVTREFLASCGYTVLEARHGEEALDLARRHAGPLHLLLTDVVLPQMTGQEAAERLRAIRPETRVLYMSGYTAATMADRAVFGPGREFLPKPFSKTQLVHKVREVLEGRIVPSSTPP
jgi:PAS domain S-box-containing protein